MNSALGYRYCQVFWDPAPLGQNSSVDSNAHNLGVSSTLKAYLVGAFWVFCFISPPFGFTAETPSCYQKPHKPPPASLRNQGDTRAPPGYLAVEAVNYDSHHPINTTRPRPVPIWLVSFHEPAAGNSGSCGSGRVDALVCGKLQNYRSREATRLRTRTGLRSSRGLSRRPRGERGRGKPWRRDLGAASAAAWHLGGGPGGAQTLGLPAIMDPAEAVLQEKALKFMVRRRCRPGEQWRRWRRRRR